jgi:hypothetical protein
MIRLGKGGDRKIEKMKLLLARAGGGGPVRGGGNRLGAGLPAGRDLHHDRGQEWRRAALRLRSGRAAGDMLLVLDDQFGPGFVKICAYFPYPIKVWLNGHKWAKRQAVQAGIGWTPLRPTVRLS